MAAEYDVFFSHAWADGDRPQQIADALTKARLCVWFDAKQINDFAGITRAVTGGLAKSKALLAYYSKTYPVRRACQWELTSAFLAAQTEGDPRRRVLVINPEEKADHIHPIELRDAKFRPAPVSGGASLQELVQAIVKHVAQLKGPLADIHPLTAPDWYGMMPVGSTWFVGRLAEMWQIHSLLHAGDSTQITGTTVASSVGRISGLGGVGKSMLAEEYAMRFGAAYPGGVFWLRAYGNDDVKTSLEPEQREVLRVDQVRKIAERLGIDAHGMTAEQVQGALARRIGSEGKPCLWVVDDVPNGLDGETLRRWFAPHAVARTLITTRGGGYGSLGKGLDLPALAPDEAYQLLISRRRPAGQDEEEQASRLAKDLGYHALALDVTASALQSSVATKPFGDFRGKLARPDKDALVLAEILADALPNGHEPSITKTMLRSIRGLGAEGLDFLRLASVLAVAPIPASLVTAVFKGADKLSDEDAEERATLAFKQVTSASLAEIAGERQEARAAHTLVSRAVRFHERGEPGRTQALRTAALVALTSEISEAAPDPRLHRQIEFQVTHARHLVSIPASMPESSLVSWLARYDYVRGAYASARTLYERALEFCKYQLGPEHPDTVILLRSVAETVRAPGDLAGARKLQEETLAIQRRVLGSEHPETALSMTDLADTLRARGDLAKARRLQEEALAVQRKVLGPEHPDTLRSMNHLAVIFYAAHDDLAGAREQFERVLAIRRRVLGPDHPDTLMTMLSLAHTLFDQGDLVGARKLQEEMLATQCQVLGPEHPLASVTAWRLHVTLQALGKRAAARAVLERYLRWLLDRDPATLCGAQPEVREYVAKVVRRSG